MVFCETVSITSVCVHPLALDLQECWCLLSGERYSDCPNTRLFANWVHIPVSVLEPQWPAPEWSLLCGEREPEARWQGCTEIGKTTALSATALSSILEALQGTSVTPSENLETCYQLCKPSEAAHIHVDLSGCMLGCVYLFRTTGDTRHSDACAMPYPCLRATNGLCVFFTSLDILLKINLPAVLEFLITF